MGISTSAAVLFTERPPGKTDGCSSCYQLPVSLQPHPLQIRLHGSMWRQVMQCPSLLPECLIKVLFSQDNIREAGKKGLMLPKSNEERVNVSVATCPSFPDVVGYFHHRAKLLLKSGNCFVTAAGKLPFSPAIMTEALGFLVLCLEESAGVSEEQRLSGTALAPVSHYITQLVSPTSTSPQTPVDQYLELLLQSLGPAGGTGYTPNGNITVHVHKG